MRNTYKSYQIINLYHKLKKYVSSQANFLSGCCLSGCSLVGLLPGKMPGMFIE